MASHSLEHRPERRLTLKQIDLALGREPERRSEHFSQQLPSLLRVGGEQASPVYDVMSNRRLDRFPIELADMDRWIYADASAHRLISDISAFGSAGNEASVLAAGHLNILYGHGEGGNDYWAAIDEAIFGVDG